MDIERDKSVETALVAKQRNSQTQVKYCTNCKGRITQSTSVGKVAEITQMRQLIKNTSGDKSKKKKKQQAYVSKDDSGSETAAIALTQQNPNKLSNS